jgi:hypothetical protein
LLIEISERGETNIDSRTKEEDKVMVGSFLFFTIAVGHMAHALDGRCKGRVPQGIYNVFLSKVGPVCKMGVIECMFSHYALTRMNFKVILG